MEGVGWAVNQTCLAAFLEWESRSTASRQFLKWFKDFHTLGFGVCSAIVGYLRNVALPLLSQDTGQSDRHDSEWKRDKDYWILNSRKFWKLKQYKMVLDVWLILGFFDFMILWKWCVINRHCTSNFEICFALFWNSVLLCGPSQPRNCDPPASALSAGISGMHPTHTPPPPPPPTPQLNLEFPSFRRLELGSVGLLCAEQQQQATASSAMKWLQCIALPCCNVQ